MKTVTISLKINVNDWANYIAVNKGGGVYEIENKPIAKGEDGFVLVANTRSSRLGTILVSDWQSSVIDLGEQTESALAEKFMHEEEPKGHPNADILMEIAKEAAINKEYWKEFDYYGISSKFESIKEEYDLLYHVGFNNKVRRKPRAIRIGNYDVKYPEEIRLSEANPNYVFINMDSVCDAELMLKALQELLGSKP